MDSFAPIKSFNSKCQCLARTNFYYPLEYYICSTGVTDFPFRPSLVLQTHMYIDRVPTSRHLPISTNHFQVLASFSC